ncbi:hypothetical protein BJV77DRAFT_992936 [Russula vinacea]|nr:hypothetical protein BJV77DRAFT_992936 [Russula vinacea]
MAPYTQIVSRDDTAVGGSASSPMTPEIIGGLAFAGAILLCACVWLGIHHYRKRTRETRDLIVKGVISEGDEKVSPRSIFSDQLTASIVLPHQNIIRPDVTKDDIMRYHMASGTMTRPFSSAANTLVPPASPMGAAMRPISIVSFQSAAGGGTSPRRTSFFGFGNRPSSVASSVTSNVSSMFGVEGRKIRQLFSPAFDDGWCIVGRDSQLKAGDVEMGAVPAWCFVKPVKGLKASRPMRTSSLGVTVQIDAGPGFSSREECISWSNF